MTDEEIQATLSCLPDKTQRLLALGPIGNNEGERGCRLCDTMAATVDIDNTRQVTTANVLLDYHDVDGSQGPECYRRCKQIYRVAGWKGEMRLK